MFFFCEWCAEMTDTSRRGGRQAAGGATDTPHRDFDTQKVTICRVRCCHCKGLCEKKKNPPKSILLENQQPSLLGDLLVDSSLAHVSP